MTDIEKVIKEVSVNTGVDRDIVKKICNFAFYFTTDVMKDPEDTHSVLFNKLFTFKLKSRFQKDKTKQYSPKI